MKSLIKPVLGIGLIASLAACTLAPKYTQPQVTIADQFPYAQQEAHLHEQAVVASQLGWQDFFADARLHRLIQLALEQNADLRVASLNAEAVRKQYMISRAELLPTLSATGMGNRGRNAADLAGGVSSINESYSVGLGIAAYELDLFGKIQSNNQAALQSYFASAANRDAAHLSLVASVAKAYFNQLYAQEAMKLAEATLQSRQKTYELSQLRHRVGVISALDLQQQTTLIEAAKAAYAVAVQQKEQANNALSLLINQPIPDDLPPALPLNQQLGSRHLSAGLPSELLLNRPDIRAAEANLRQANANIGAARAAFFPSIRLTASMGSASTELNRLFTGVNQTWSFAPQINLPIFAWGSLKANLDVAHIRKQAQVAAYESAVQSAFRDVANALVAREQLEQVYQANQKQYQAFNKHWHLVQLRYQHGVYSALEWLDAERSKNTAHTALLSSELTRLENMVDLYKALGGGLKRHSQ